MSYNRGCTISNQSYLAHSVRVVGELTTPTVLAVAADYVYRTSIHSYLSTRTTPPLARIVPTIVGSQLACKKVPRPLRFMPREELSYSLGARLAGQHAKVLLPLQPRALCTYLKILKKGHLKELGRPLPRIFYYLAFF